MDMDKLLYQIIDRIGQTQDEMKVILTEMQADLRYHIKRTDLLEAEVKLIEERLPRPFPWKKVGVIVGIICTVVGTVYKII